MIRIDHLDNLKELRGRRRYCTKKKLSHADQKKISEPLPYPYIVVRHQ
jgi:hypothetical protein